MAATSKLLNCVKLSSGHAMPAIGFGTFQAKDQEIRKAMHWALETGYRHIDTAYVYQNEKEIGEVLQEWFKSGRIKREDLFITTKLPMWGNRAADVPKFINKSLESLQLSYVDLYLIHIPVGMIAKGDNDVEKDADGNIVYDHTTDIESLYKAMEEQVDNGKTKSIGISNFNISQIERILKVCRIHPANLQVEIHAYHQQSQLMDFCFKNNISLCAYGPIGAPYKPPIQDTNGKDLPSLIENPTVISIANKLNRTPAQVLLKYLLHLGLIVIPKSANQERIKQNFQVFDFVLSTSDMADLKNLDQGKNGKMFGFNGKAFTGAEKHPEFPFHD